MKSPDRANGGAWIKPEKSGRNDRRFLCGQPGHLGAECRAAALIRPVFQSSQPRLDIKNKPIADFYEVLYSTDDHKCPPPPGLVSFPVVEGRGSSGRLEDAGAAPLLLCSAAAEDNGSSRVVEVETAAVAAGAAATAPSSNATGDNGSSGRVRSRAPALSAFKSSEIYPEMWDYVDELLKRHQPLVVETLVKQKYGVFHTIKIPTFQQIKER